MKLLLLWSIVVGVVLKFLRVIGLAGIETV